MLINVAEPSHPAKISKVTVLNSTSVQLEWDPIPEEFRNGIIIKYTIRFRDESTKSESEVFFPRTAIKAIFNGLRQSREYSFWTLAATSKGMSPPSDIRKARTKGEKIQEEKLYN